MKVNEYIFTPIIKAFRDKTRYIINSGGTRSGKTYNGLIAIIVFLKIKAAKKQPFLFSVVSQTYPHLRKGAIKDFIQIMQKAGQFDPLKWNKTESTYNFGNGVQLEFFSCDNAGKVHGPARDALFVNEGQYISKDVFIHLAVRTEGCILIDFNPTREFWAHELPVDQRVWVHSTYLNNKEFLSENQIREIENQKSNPNWWRVYGLGEVGMIEGQVYTNWQKISLLDYKAIEKTEYYGLDFGFNDPLAMVGVKYNDGTFYVRQMMYKRFVDAGQIAAELIKTGLINDGKMLCVGDCARPEIIADLMRHKFNIRPSIKGAGSVNAGISFLQAKNVCFVEGSTDLDYEQKNYVYETDKDGKLLETPVDSDNHLLDAFRYIAWYLKFALKINF
jgi:phage terminase large subunit